MLSPAVILVNTQLPENIGAAARACMNFGLEELRLVAPREDWPHERAYALAGHAKPILDAAKLFKTTRDAVADCTRVYAMTARGREMVKPVFTPALGMETIRNHAERSALLFGPERTGLTNDDVALCDAIITIPTGSELASINVAQSVVVMGYEWLRREGASLPGGTTGPAASSVATDKNPLTTKEGLAHLLDHLERELDAVDFWKVADKKPKMWLNLRSIFARMELTDQEVRSLHGVIASLSGKG